MKEKIKQTPQTPFLPGFENDTRTDAEVIKDIQKKGRRNLDPRETEMVRKQDEEDRADMLDNYPH